MPNDASHARECFELTERLVEYRHQPISAQLRTIGEKHSMLHLDVLILLYHFARICQGQILEVGPYIGGSSIAMGLGARASDQQPKRVVSIEPGGKFADHPSVPTNDILADLRKNLLKRGVADLVDIFEGFSGSNKITKQVYERFAPGEIGLYFIDADGEAARDISAYRDRLGAGCHIVIDDYYGTSNKTQPTREQVDAMCAREELLPLGVFGWGTWVGHLL